MIMQDRCITKTQNRVIFVVRNQFTNEIETMELQHRYAIILRTRWSLVYNYSQDYFIENGDRGCYIGERYDKDGFVYDVWDLSKIFKDINFINNDYKHLKENR